MKKLSIHLDNNTEDAAHSYYPGNTIHGTVRFDTSASVKYTCIKIRFVGTVSTKIAKTTDEVFVLSDQVVLLGQANNATESVLPQGRHAWVFAFDVPLQHIPSSGKYRHGTVKYTLTATVASKSFLGSMQEIKANKILQLQDLVSCALEPYCNPVTVKGSSNVKPDTNKPKNLASAAVNLSQSAFLKGQKIQIVIDLAHPRALHRDPGCWVQLIRKESYCAGEQSKEYSHIVASSTIGLHLDSAKQLGKVFADVTLPKDCPPTMFTTRVIAIQYYLLLLFDMRPKTGFLERRNRQTLSKKVRTKLLSSPGGFEVEVPVVIATVSNDTLQAQPKPWTQLSSSPSDVDMKLTGAVSQLSLGSLPSPTPSPSLQPSSPYSTLPGQYPVVPTTPPTQFRRSPDLEAAKSASSSFIPRTQYHASSATVGPSYQWKGSPDRRAATLPAFGSISQASSSSLQLSNFSKPLPTTPTADRPSPSLSNASSSPFTSQAALFAAHGYGAGSSSSTAASSSTSSLPYFSSPVARAPQSYFSPPPPPVDGHGYPREKENFASPGPAVRQLQLPRQPQLLRVQSATAPSAVDLGLGAASPAPLHRHLQNGSLTLSHFAAGGGAVAGSGSGSSSGTAPSSNRPDTRSYRLSTVPDIKTPHPMPPSGPTDHGFQQAQFQGSASSMDATRYQQQHQHQQHQQQWSSSAPALPPHQQYQQQQQQQRQQQPGHAMTAIHHGIRNSVIDSENDPAPPYSAVSL